MHHFTLPLYSVPAIIHNINPSYHSHYHFIKLQKHLSLTSHSPKFSHLSTTHTTISYSCPCSSPFSVPPYPTLLPIYPSSIIIPVSIVFGYQSTFPLSLPLYQIEQLFYHPSHIPLSISLLTTILHLHNHHSLATTTFPSLTPAGKLCTMPRIESHDQHTCVTYLTQES